MKKQKLLLLLALLLSIITIKAQSGFCPSNFFDNGDLEIGTPTNGDQDINLAQGFSPIWPTGSVADFYASNAGPFNFPSPATGNYAGLWITNVNGGTGFREGLYNTFLTPLAQNSGSYTFNFDVACLYKDAGSSTIEIGIYGIDNPTSVLGAQPTSMTIPSNLNLFPGNTVLLGTISITGECSNTKQTQSITINTNGMSLANITNIMITKSDTLIDWGNGGGKRYIGLDNFCLSVAPPQDQGAYCCEGDNLVENGNFENGLTGISTSYINTPFGPGSYDVRQDGNPFNANITDHSFCEDSSLYATNDSFMVVNGKTQQPSGTSSVIWEQTINIQPEKNFKLCANFKNMPQCTFDILPEIQIEIDGTLYPWTVINTDASNACDWLKIEECFTSYNDQIKIKFYLKEDGNGDGNDLAIDDIAVLEKLDQNLSITVQNQGTPQQITGSINTINTTDDTVLVGQECQEQNNSYQYYWFVYELTSYPFNGPIDFINMAPNSWSWSSNLGGFSTQLAPASNINPIWNLTTTFPNYTFDNNKLYVIGMFVPSCCESCYDEAWTYQLTLNGARSSSSNFDTVFTHEVRNYLKSMFREFSANSQEITDPINTIFIHPNPVNDILNISSKSNIKAYEIYDVLGKRVTTKKINDKKIDVSSLQNSMYFISIETEDGKKETLKFIKK